MPNNHTETGTTNASLLDQRLQKAIRQQREGKLDSAQRKCRSILKKAPNHGETLQLLAILMQQSGNSKSALHYMQKALRTDPENPHLLKNLAEICRSRGDLEQAQQYVQFALMHDPQQVDALFVSAATFFEQEKHDKAIEQFSRVIALNPDDADAHNELGNLLCITGKPESAINHYQRALLHRPGFSDCRINLADTFNDLGENDAAIEHYQRVLESEPHNAIIHNRLGGSFEARGDREMAITCFELALEQDPLLLDARLNLGRLCLEQDPHQAENWFKSVLDIDPKYAAGYYWLGILFQTLGKFERASNYLRQATRIDPEYSLAWYRLSLDQDFEISNLQVKRLEQQFDERVNKDQIDEPLVSLGFALGKFHEQSGNYASAFKYFEHGNQIKSAQHHFDKDLHEAQIDNVINTFDAEFFQQRNGWGVNSELPIFIIGMPRSGTTLVEQILSAHPHIYGAGELRSMLELTASLKLDDQSVPQSHAARVAALPQDQIARIALQQVEKLRALAPDATHVTDKLPGNYFRLGLIRLLFPRARIIHCRRDPMDSCWSCYQQNFESGLHFCNDLESLGYAYRGYQRLMSHWHRIFPGEILDFDYEELVHDPETRGRELLDYLGCEWDPLVLEFQQQQRPVNTASIWQVRQSIYRSSIGRWKPYQQFLQPLSQLVSDYK